MAVVHALTGTLLASTDGPGLRLTSVCGQDRCARRRGECSHDLTGRPGLASPDETPGYRPGRALDRFVRSRDRRCRFPGWTRVPRGGELDHDRRWAEGPTSADNLVAYCTRHHRGKHQAPGWQHLLVPDGGLVVSSPTGLTIVTEPPPFPTTRPSAGQTDDPAPF